MYREIIERLLSYPQREQIQIDFDLKKKIFRLSVPIFLSKKLPEKVKEYVLARKDLAFKPHATHYRIDGEKIFLTQEIPFLHDFQSTTRGEVEHFLHLSKHCHKMLSEIAIEDVYKNALRI